MENNKKICIETYFKEEPKMLFLFYYIFLKNLK